MTHDEFMEMYEDYNDELYHSWVTSLDPVKRAAQQAKQKAYNAAYYLRNKAKWLKYNGRRALNRVLGIRETSSTIPSDQLAARQNAAYNKAMRVKRDARTAKEQERIRKLTGLRNRRASLAEAETRRNQAEFSKSAEGQARIQANRAKKANQRYNASRRSQKNTKSRLNAFGYYATNANPVASYTNMPYGGKKKKKY